MPRLQTVLFDLDGTLLDSAPDICQSINHMLADEGHPTLSNEEIIPMIGDGAMELCRRALLKTGGVAPDDLYPCVQRYVAHYRSLPPDPAQIYPNVIEVLNTLRAKEVKLAVCTNKNEISTVQLLRGLDMLHYFDFVAGGDTFPVHKPNVGHVMGIFEALEVTPVGALFVGDGPNDAAVSKKAGIPCFIITHGYGVDYTQIECDKMIAGMEELLPAAKVYGFEF